MVQAEQIFDLFHIFVQVRVNLPNGDMVGHTGDIEATIVACKAADEAVKVWCFTFLYVVFQA